MSNDDRLAAFRAETEGNGTCKVGEFLPSAWPGMYPVIYLAADNSTLCAKCANAEESNGGQIVDAMAYMEGPPTYCDECNAEIESAYGDPDAEAIEAARLERNGGDNV